VGHIMHVTSKADLDEAKVLGWIEEIVARRFRGFVAVKYNEQFCEWEVSLVHEDDGMPWNNSFFVGVEGRKIYSKHVMGSNWCRWVQYTLFVELAKRLKSKIYDEGLERGYEPKDYGNYRSYYLAITEYMESGFSRVFVRNGYHNQAPKGWWKC